MNIICSFVDKFFIFKNGRNTINEMKSRKSATKLESIDVRFVFINPNEKAQINDTIIKYNIDFYKNVQLNKLNILKIPHKIIGFAL